MEQARLSPVLHATLSRYAAMRDATRSPRARGHAAARAVPGPGGPAGYTMAEVLIVVAIAGVLLMMAAPSLSRLGTDSRVGNAAVAVAADLDYARGLAARLNVPVRIAYDASTMTYTFTNRVSGAVLARTAVGGSDSEYGLTTFSFDPAGSATTVDVYPNGLASSSATFELGAGDYTRTITMTRAGLVSISSP